MTADPADQPELAAYLCTLCGTLLRRFDRNGEMADIDDAVRAGRQAVTVMRAAISAVLRSWPTWVSPCEPGSSAPGTWLTWMTTIRPGGSRWKPPPPITPG